MSTILRENKAHHLEDHNILEIIDEYYARECKKYRAKKVDYTCPIDRAKNTTEHDYRISHVMKTYSATNSYQFMTEVIYFHECFVQKCIIRRISGI